MGLFYTTVAIWFGIVLISKRRRSIGLFYMTVAIWGGIGILAITGIGGDETLAFALAGGLLWHGLTFWVWWW